MDRHRKSPARAALPGIERWLVLKLVSEEKIPGVALRPRTIELRFGAIIWAGIQPLFPPAREIDLRETRGRLKFVS